MCTPVTSIFGEQPYPLKIKLIRSSIQLLREFFLEAIAFAVAEIFQIIFPLANEKKS